MSLYSPPLYKKVEFPTLYLIQYRLNELVLAEVRFSSSNLFSTWNIYGRKYSQSGWSFTKAGAIKALEKILKENGFRELMPKLTTLL